MTSIAIAPASANIGQKTSGDDSALLWSCIVTGPSPKGHAPETLEASRPKARVNGCCFQLCLLVVAGSVGGG